MRWSNLGFRQVQPLSGRRGWSYESPASWKRWASYLIFKRYITWIKMESMKLAVSISISIDHDRSWGKMIIFHTLEGASRVPSWPLLSTAGAGAGTDGGTSLKSFSKSTWSVGGVFRHLWFMTWKEIQKHGGMKKQATDVVTSPMLVFWVYDYVKHP